MRRFATLWFDRLRACTAAARREPHSRCPNLAQRARRAAVAGLSLLGATLAARAACPGPPIVLQPLAESLWWVAAAAGDADAGNRGQVSNLLIAREGHRVWALGTGPSAAFGKRLACHVREQLNQPVTDAIAPWPRPELVLGQAGMPGVRRWAHADVARAMAQRCPHCVERLRQRLGEAAADLGAHPVALPDRRVAGAHGRLGPWNWWRWQRAPGVPVTVWQHRSQPSLVYAPGLLWGEGAPDGRDADAASMARAMTALRQAFAADPPAGPVRRWLGEQGPPVADAVVTDHLRYWPALEAAATEAVQRGDDETAPAPSLPGLPGLSQGLLHALNWQRAWRQSEERSFQRSRR